MFKNDTDLISVIIPVYNRGYCIKRSIISVLMQTYKNLELIIIDDGSIDNTEQVVKSIKDSRIKYFYQENKGACAARNLGVKVALGNFIAFQDSDDEWAKDKLEKQFNKLINSNGDIVFCRMQTNVENSTSSKSWITPDLKYKVSDFGLDLIMRRNFVSTQMLLMKKEVAVSIPFDTDFPRFQDWDFMLRVYQKYTVVFCDEVLVYQHIQNDSLTKQSSKTVTACHLLDKKYTSLYIGQPNLRARLYDNFATELAECDKQDAISYFKKSLKSYFRFQTLIKYIFFLFGFII